MKLKNNIIRYTFFKESNENYNNECIKNKLKEKLI